MSTKLLVLFLRLDWFGYKHVLLQLSCPRRQEQLNWMLNTADNCFQSWGYTRHLLLQLCCPHRQRQLGKEGESLWEEDFQSFWLLSFWYTDSRTGALHYPDEYAHQGTCSSIRHHKPQFTSSTERKTRGGCPAGLYHLYMSDSASVRHPLTYSTQLHRACGLQDHHSTAQQTWTDSRADVGKASGSPQQHTTNKSRCGIGSLACPTCPNHCLPARLCQQEQQSSEL
eukprot:1160435-Pelagomonas_calceolata.AAC.12